MKKFWQNNDIVWSEGIKEMALVIKDGSGAQGQTRPDPRKVFPHQDPHDARPSSTGAKYDPRLVPNLPQAAEKK